jgi:hypothetical protein
MRPMSATEALKNTTPSFLAKNRYEVLRSRKDSGSDNVFTKQTGRDRVNSIKRKASAEINTVSSKKLNQTAVPTVDVKKLEAMDRKLASLRGISGKLNEDAAKLKVDIGLENVIRTICEFVDVGSSMFEDIISVCKVETAAPEPDPDPDQTELAVADPAPDPGASQTPALTQSQSVPVNQNMYSQVAAKKPQGRTKQIRAEKAEPPVDPKVQAFRDAVKLSERSTLIFNLDLGRHKTLNENTILTKATVALSEAAAAVEGNKGKPPSKEAVAALDDVFSVTENVTLYGRVTKPYVNKANDADPRNKTFFTLPVQYEFRDKDTKFEAERVLKDTCNVDCTTPYPTILRHCINEVISHMRKEYPNEFIKVTVDTTELALKVTRKSKSKGVFKLDDPIKLPLEVLDIKARSVPEGFTLRNLPVRKKSNNLEPDPVADADMEGEDESL